MFSGQYILVIGALSILTLLIITFYNTDSKIDTLTIDNEAIIAASGIGQTIIEKLSSRPFDEKVIDNNFNSADSLTSPENLGPDSGETAIHHFDDLDDFNNYSKSYSLIKLGTFDLDVSVHYVYREDPDTKVTERTFYKLATVYVSNPYLINTIELHLIASY